MNISAPGRSEVRGGRLLLGSEDERSTVETSPASSWRTSWLWPGLATMAVALTVIPRLNWIGINEDQAVIAGWAMQMAAGQVPYRDYFAFVAPGSIALYAVTFKLFGASLLVDRLLTGLSMLISVALVGRMGRLVLPAVWATAVAALWGTWLPVFQQFGQHHFWSMAFTLAMFACVLEGRGRARPGRWFLAAGASAALALIFLQAALPAVVVALFSTVLVKPDLRRSLLPMLVGGFLPGGAVLVALAAVGALPGFLDDTARYTLTVYAPGNALPFPWNPTLLHDAAFWEASVAAFWSIPMHWLIGVAAPVGVALVALVGLVRWSLHREINTDLVLLALFSTGLFVSVAIVRMSDQNLWLSAPLALAIVARRLWQIRGKLEPRRAWLMFSPVLLIYVTGVTPMPLGWMLTCRSGHSGYMMPVESRAGTICVQSGTHPVVSRAVAFSDQHPAEQMAFLPTASSLYIVTGRVPPVPNVWLVPGQTPPAQLERTESALLSRPVVWVVYWSIDLTKDLPVNFATHDAQRFGFDDFLAGAYQREDHDGLVVYRIRG